MIVICDIGHFWQEFFSILALLFTVCGNSKSSLMILTEFHVSSKVSFGAKDM